MKLQINEPCFEPWEGMQTNANGKHCSKCDKTVVDFTKFNDNEIVTYFKQNKNVCGRFENSQLNRELTKRHKSYIPLKYAACGLIALSAFGAQAQVKDTLADNSNTHILDRSIMGTGDNVVKIKVVQPNESEKKIVKMMMAIDTFHIAIEIDSSNAFSFHIPTSLYYVMQMQSKLVNQKGDTITLEVDLNTLGRDYSFICSGETWSYYSNFTFFNNVIQYTWGPPVSILPIVNLRIPEQVIVDTITQTETITLGDATNVDSLNWNTESKYEYKKLDKKKYKELRQESKVWYWWVGALLAIVGGWIIR